MGDEIRMKIFQAWIVSNNEDIHQQYFGYLDDELLFGEGGLHFIHVSILNFYVDAQIIL